MKFRPLHDRVVVKRIDAEEKSALRQHRYLNAALLPTFEQEARHFLDEQRHAAGALGHAVDGFLSQRVASGQL